MSEPLIWLSAGLLAIFAICGIIFARWLAGGLAPYEDPWEKEFPQNPKRPTE